MKQIANTWENIEQKLEKVLIFCCCLVALYIWALCSLYRCNIPPEKLLLCVSNIGCFLFCGFFAVCLRFLYSCQIKIVCIQIRIHIFHGNKCICCLHRRIKIDLRETDFHVWKYLRSCTICLKYPIFLFDWLFFDVRCWYIEWGREGSEEKKHCLYPPIKCGWFICVFPLFARVLMLYVGNILWTLYLWLFTHVSKLPSFLYTLFSIFI